MNHWVIAFPCLMYLGSIGTYLSSRMARMLEAHLDSIATGTLFLFQNRGGALSNLCSGLVYFSISLSLNVTLTLATVVRLVLHGKNVRATTGTPAGLSGPYKIIATTLVESSALFTASSLLVIGPLAAKSTVTDLFFPILAETQVRALPCPRSLGGLSNVTTDRVGHCFTAYHSTNCQQEGVDEQRYRLGKYQFVQTWGPRGVHGWQRYHTRWVLHEFGG